MAKNEQRFWDNIAEKYAQQPIRDERAYQRKLEMTQNYFNTDMHVLEFGCGTGSTAILHAPHVAKYNAIDVSGNMIEIGKAKAAEEGITNINFMRSDFESYEAQGAGYDVIMGMSIVHLMRDRGQIFAKIHQLLKPGGVFISSTVCLADTKWRFIQPVTIVGRWIGKLPFVSFLKQKRLVQEIETEGFEVEEKWQHGKGMVVFIIARKKGD